MLTSHWCCRHGPGHVRRIATLLVFALGFACEGCSDTTGSPPAVAPAPRTVTHVVVAPSTLNLVLGTEGKLHASARNAQGAEIPASPVWSSDDPLVASVAPKGDSFAAIVGVAVGTTVIRVVAGGVAASVSVIVRPPDPPVLITITPDSLHLAVGVARFVTAVALDSAAQITAAQIVWSSSNPAVVSVEPSTGLITAVAVGFSLVMAQTAALRDTVGVSVVARIASFAFSRLSKVPYGTFDSDVLLSGLSNDSLERFPRAPQSSSLAHATWSPDRRLIAVELIHAFVGPPFAEWLDYSSDVGIVDASLSAPDSYRQLTSTGLARSPVWSPDGQSIAFLQQPALFSLTDELLVVAAAGGESRRLPLPDGYYYDPQWSPDGSRLVVSGFVGTDNVSRVLTIRADGSDLRYLTPPGETDYAPIWSLDGTHILFQRFRRESSTRFFFDLLSVDPDGGSPHRIASREQYIWGLAWSPDGRSLLGTIGNAIYLMSADGSSLVQLTAPPPGHADSAPAWRP